jgi:hypothetical protein
MNRLFGQDCLSEVSMESMDESEGRFITADNSKRRLFCEERTNEPPSFAALDNSRILGLFIHKLFICEEVTNDRRLRFFQYRENLLSALRSFQNEH